MLQSLDVTAPGRPTSAEHHHSSSTAGQHPILLTNRRAFRTEGRRFSLDPPTHVNALNKLSTSDIQPLRGPHRFDFSH